MVREGVSLALLLSFLPRLPIAARQLMLQQLRRSKHAFQIPVAGCDTIGSTLMVHFVQRDAQDKERGDNLHGWSNSGC